MNNEKKQIILIINTHTHALHDMWPHLFYMLETHLGTFYLQGEVKE